MLKPLHRDGKGGFRFGLAPWSSAGSILAAAIALWLALVAVTALLLWNKRQGDIQDAKLRGAAITALLQAHTASTLNAIDNALLDLARTLERERPGRHDRRFRDEMDRRVSTMPYVHALYVIGPDGEIQHDSNYPRAPEVSLADQHYFRQYLQADPPETAVSGPLWSRSGSGWVVTVTRRIGSGAGFRGVSVASIQLEYFSRLYEEVGLREEGDILLFHRNGKLLAQYPGTFGRVGESYAHLPLFKDYLTQAGWGAALTPAAVASYPRLVNYAALEGVPLVVARMQNMTKQLAAWQTLAIASGVGLSLLLAAILFGLRRYMHARLERRRRQDRILQMEKMEALGQLTGSLAHDFRNILGILATNIALIRRLGTGDARIQAALDRAVRAVDNGAAITQRLMSFGRKRHLQVACWDLNAAVPAVLPLLENAAGSQCKVVFEPGKGSHLCRLDRTQLDTALINLVVNARHAIEGQGLITVQTSNIATSDLHLPADVLRKQSVCVTVRDNGKGMTQEVRQHALEPFFTTKGEEGTGLGLAQVCAFMQQLGGDIAIESQVGVGTAVHLCFPACALDAESAEGAAPQSQNETRGKQHPAAGCGPHLPAG